MGVGSRGAFDSNDQRVMLNNGVSRSTRAPRRRASTPEPELVSADMSAVHLREIEDEGQVEEQLDWLRPRWRRASVVHRPSTADRTLW